MLFGRLHFFCAVAIVSARESRNCCTTAAAAAVAAVILCLRSWNMHTCADMS